MFGIGMQELIIIAVVALLIVGPKKLPDLAKSLGKGFSEFRKATDDVKDDDHKKDGPKNALQEQTDTKDKSNQKNSNQD